MHFNNKKNAIAKQTTTQKPNKKTQARKEKYHDFDGNWKGMIHEFIEEFIEFFLPQLYPHVDFSYPPEFLDTELQNILESIGTNKRILDKLVKVRLKNGSFKWLLIHIEVQSYFEKLFAERMFLLYAMIFSKFRQKILGIVIYTNKKTPKIFNKYEDSGFGSTAFYEFLAYKVAEQKEATLILSENIFALFVLANLYVTQTNKKDPKRLLMKEKLFQLAVEKKINLDKIIRLLTFVDGIMQLSKDLQEEYNNYVVKYLKSEKTMVAESKTDKIIAEYFEMVKEKQRATEQTSLKQLEDFLGLEISKPIRILYFDYAWTTEQIAELFNLEKELVEAIIDVIKNRK